MRGGRGRRTEDRYGDMVVDVMNARNGYGEVQYSICLKWIGAWMYGGVCMDVWMWMAEGRSRGGVGEE